MVDHLLREVRLILALVVVQVQEMEMLQVVLADLV
jgi:hypothetical protein